MSLLIANILKFKESTGKGGNYFERLPSYLTSLMTEEYSPVRTYMGNVEPNKLIRITIIIEELKDK